MSCCEKNSTPCSVLGLWQPDTMHVRVSFVRRQRLRLQNTRVAPCDTAANLAKSGMNRYLVTKSSDLPLWIYSCTDHSDSKTLATARS